MQSRTNFFPVYVSGQYLTSDLLNATQNFLWGEETATRYLLTGNGIASGMVADFTGGPFINNISLSGGVASTIDGYIIQAPQNGVFTKAAAISLVTYTTPDGATAIATQADFNTLATKMSVVAQATLAGYEVFTDSIGSNLLPDGVNALNTFQVPLPVNLAPPKYILIAFVQITDQQNNECQQGDCNTKGIQENYSIRYFFVNNTAASPNNIPIQNVSNQELPTCSVARIKTLSASGSKPGFYQKSFDALTKCNQELSPFFTPNTGRLYTIAGVLGSSAQAALTASSGKYSQVIGSVTNTNCPQYYVLFAADVEQAINELVVCYNEYARRYFTSNINRIRQVAIIGGLGHTVPDQYRYYFIQGVDNNQKQSDTNKLSMLFNRVLALVDNFIVLTAISGMASKVGKLSEIPTMIGDTLLGNRAIPYYYDVFANGASNTILLYWNPGGGSLKNVFNYYDPVLRSDMATKAITANWYDANFFRIEGHIGMQKDLAISAINNLIFNEGLPVQLVDCSVTNAAPKKWIDFYTAFQKAVAGLSAALKQSAVNTKQPYTAYDFQQFATIQTSISQVSYRNVDDVTKLVNDFTAVSGIFNAGYNAITKAAALKKANKGVAPKVAKRLKTTNVISRVPTANDYTQFYKTVQNNPTYSVENITQLYKAALAEQVAQQAQKVVLLEDLTGLEYMGGVPRGGTFVLLHDGATVLGDGCLAYYYRISQARVFSS